MGTFLMFVFLVILLVVISALSLLKNVTSAIFGKPSSFSGNRSGHSSNYTANDNRKENGKAAATKKIFAKNEGEYVKYEEIKE